MMAESAPRPVLTAVPTGTDVEWWVVIRCPGCGQVQGRVTQRRGQEREDLLATSLLDYEGCRRRRCPPLRWPSVAEVEAAGERARRRRARKGVIRAHAADVVVVTSEQYVMRGRRLGEGPGDVLRDEPDSLVLPAADHDDGQLS